MITSSSNQQMKNLALLMKKSKERKEQGLFVVEGPRMAYEAPISWIRQIYVSESFMADPLHWAEISALCGEPLPEDFLERGARAGAGFRVEAVSDSVMKSVSDTQTPQGILCVLTIPQYQLSQLLRGRDTMILALETIQDPGNLGTMLRSGEGAGVTGILMNSTTVDLFNPKTVRSTMGSIFRIPFYIAEDFQGAICELKGQGVPFYAAHLKGSNMYDQEDYDGACAFMIGNEGNGLSDQIADLADSYIRIPMDGDVESLNAAVSASILMYECNRQRRANEVMV